MAIAQREGEEIWEMTVPGRVHVEITNHRGRPQDLTVRGVGQRLRISTTDREIAQERIRGEEHDPFRNGTLRRIDTGERLEEKSKDELSDEDLTEVFTLTGDEFETIVDELSELNVRRMNAMADTVDATSSQSAYLKKIIEDRYPVGGTTPTYEEMMRSPK